MAEYSRNAVPGVFNCQKCGHCCTGTGGIVLSRKDLNRIAGFLSMDPAVVLEKFSFFSNGKYKLKTGADERCIFFSITSGCKIHENKPDVCRAWPFFRGNLEDDFSLHLAKDYCPGIRHDCTFAEFVEAGLDYLQKQGISGENTNANALNIAHIMKTFKKSSQS